MSFRSLFVRTLFGGMLVGCLAAPGEVQAARRMNLNSMMRRYQQALQIQQQQMQQAQEQMRQQQQARAAAEQHRKDLIHKSNEAHQAAAKERAQRARDRAAAKAKEKDEMAK